MNNKEQILSIFVDESGDSGDYNKNKNVFSDKFYIITLSFMNKKMIYRRILSISKTS